LEQRTPAHILEQRTPAHILEQRTSAHILEQRTPCLVREVPPLDIKDGVQFVVGARMITGSVLGSADVNFEKYALQRQQQPLPYRVIFAVDQV
jgi:hypothetical protein